MSKENVKKFMEVIQKNKELQENLEELIEKGQTFSAADIINFAGENGYAFSVEELKATLETIRAELLAEGELDDEALDQVAGGKAGAVLLISIGLADLVCDVKF